MSSDATQNLAEKQRFLNWMIEGGEYFDAVLSRMSDNELRGPSRLPGWSNRQLLAHVGYNARALRNLAHWAATGEPTPMYASTSARDSQIESGAQLLLPDLREFVAREQLWLLEALLLLDDDHWSANVGTAQGRQVPARHIPWLRAREVWVHAVDLGGHGSFDHFPNALVDALLNDVIESWQRRSLPTPALRPVDRPLTARNEPGLVILGTAANLAGWLTGRSRPDSHNPPGVATSDGSSLPELPVWL
ncbi:maleylpyruvate isomerase N-terminal domain-containing protein [Micromonospora sp. LZ34]